MSWSRAAMELAAMSALMGRHVEVTPPKGSALDYLFGMPTDREMRITIDLLSDLEPRNPPRRPDDPVGIADAEWQARQERKARNAEAAKAAAELKRQRRRARNLRLGNNLPESGNDFPEGAAVTSKDSYPLENTEDK